MIAARTTVSLDGPGRRDRAHFVLVAVGSGFHPSQHGRGQGGQPERRFAAASHQNSRNSSLSNPRILS